MGSRLRNALHPRNSNSLNRPSNIVSDFVFQEISDFVRKELSALRVKKSSGLKDIHSRSLKIASNTLASPLTYIFNLSLETGQIPKVWKSATITPLHKSGALTGVNNFRPISVLIVVMKISNVQFIIKFTTLSRCSKPSLLFAGSLLENVNTIKYLGLSLDSVLNWHSYIDAVAAKVSRSETISLLSRIRKYLSEDTYVDSCMDP